MLAPAYFSLQANVSKFTHNLQSAQSVQPALVQFTRIVAIASGLVCDGDHVTLRGSHNSRNGEDLQWDFFAENSAGHAFWWVRSPL